MRSFKEASEGEALLFVDQEGGRVQRVKPPFWTSYPPAHTFGQIYHYNAEQAKRLCYLNAALMGYELHKAGFEVTCAPVLDRPVSGADPVIGDRAFGEDVDTIISLGGESLKGLRDGGVLSVIKHMPGHGRARVDSHQALPCVREDSHVLETTDFLPFKALKTAPMAMTAHMIYEAFDPDAPATLSQKIFREVLRGFIGFDNLIMTDDIMMKALKGCLKDRTDRAFTAGCDIVLHASGVLKEMEEVACAAPSPSGPRKDRMERVIKARLKPCSYDWRAMKEEYDALLMSLQTLPVQV